MLLDFERSGEIAPEADFSFTIITASLTVAKETAAAILRTGQFFATLGAFSGRWVFDSIVGAGYRMSSEDNDMPYDQDLFMKY